MTPQAMLFSGAGQPLQSRPQQVSTLIGSSIRVRVLCCTLCQSDLATYEGRRVEATPTVLGHEVVGAIAEFGPAARRIDAAEQVASVGDRITWAIVANCGDCYFCRHDVPQKCERGVKYGHHATVADCPDGGGLAEILTLVPGTVWFRVPDTLATPVASLANCAGATAAAILEAAGDFSGRSVIVFGTGLLGLMACAMAKESGARVVVAIDPVAQCRTRAITFGATSALDPSAVDFEQSMSAILGARGADVALELAGRAATVEQCLSRVRVGGTIILAGTVSPTPPVPLDPQQFVRRMLTLRGVHNYQPRHLKMAIDFLTATEERFPWMSLIAATFPLERASDAFAAARVHIGRRIAVITSEASS